MLIVVWLLHRWIDKTNHPIVTATMLIMVLQYLHRLFAQFYEPCKIGMEKSLATSYALRNVWHMNIDIDTTITHRPLAINRPWHNHNALLGVVLSLVVGIFRILGVCPHAVNQHLTHLDCYFFCRYHNTLPNSSSAFLFALSMSICIALGKSVFALSSAGRMTL